MRTVGRVADSSYLRFPHLAQNLLTFVAADDVWLAPLDAAADGGARAWRLTADRAAACHPRLSPAGTHVAWTSRRDGNGESYAVPVDGGPISRLTYWAKPMTGIHGVRGWLSESEVLVTGWPRNFTPKRGWAYAVPLDGPARELPYGPVGDLSFAPDGGVLLNPISTRDPGQWKRYRGGRTGQIWYAPDGHGFSRILADLGGNPANPMWVSGRVAFLSDHEGVGALYSALPDGSDLRRHGYHGSFYARFASTDGTRVVYQCAGELWLLESLDADPVRLDVRLGGARSGRVPFPVPAASGLGDFALCRSGRILAAEVRGTAHRLPVEQGPARAVLAEPGVRARLPLILPGTSTIVCVSDSDGEDGIDVVPGDDDAPRRILSGQLGRVLELAASPDAKTLAVACDDGRLLTVELESGTASELIRSSVTEVTGLSFSPDSAYLAWAQPWTMNDLDPVSRIRLARLADRVIVEVTEERFSDFAPVFTLDGKYLAFLSNRTYEPDYDTHLFDLGFLPGVRPYVVGLAADTPSPFAAELDGRPAKPEAEKTEKDHVDAVSPTVVDIEGIETRVEPFPVRAGSYTALRAADGAVLWLDKPRNGQLGENESGGEPPQPRLLSYDLRKRRLSTLVDGLEKYVVSGDGTRLAFRDGGDLVVQAVTDRNGDDAITVDLDRIRVTVDPDAEWRQMYDENWRLMRDNYWRADMGGTDWAGVRERYRPLLDRIGSTDDLHDLLWEVGGELGTSHAYVLPAGNGAASALALGLLGADLERDDEGVWRIARILPGENSVSKGRSPLQALGVAAREGDAIVAVGGRPVDAARGPNAALVGKANKPVELTLRRDGAEDRRVVVTPLATETTLRYHDLIRSRRAQVHELSEGRLGYVHVPDMQSLGWADFHRDLRREIARDGLVVDFRSNNGGHTSELVIEKLTRKIIAWWSFLEVDAHSYPIDAPRGPLVALSDECSGSDGDIVTQAFRRHGLGPVVGTRTWGGVVGIDDKYRLVDGTMTTQPKLAFWFDDAEWGVENYGVEPDVEVVITPQDWAAGRDPQLLEGVRLALESLERTPALRPPALPGGSRRPLPESSSTQN